MLDGVDRGLRHADLQRHRLMRGPFKPAVAFARSDENGDLALTLAEARLKAQIAPDGPVGLAENWRMQLDPRWPLEAPNRAASGIGAAVEHKLSGIVEILPTRQRQAAARFGINVVRQHIHPLFRFL